MPESEDVGQGKNGPARPGVEDLVDHQAPHLGHHVRHGRRGRTPRDGARRRQQAVKREHPLEDEPRGPPVLVLLAVEVPHVCRERPR